MAFPSHGFGEVCPSIVELAQGVVHKFPQFLRAATGGRDLACPLLGCCAVGQFENGESAFEDGSGIDRVAHRAVGRDEHWVHTFIDPAAEDVHARSLGFLNNCVRFSYDDWKLLLGQHHGFARKRDEVFGHDASVAGVTIYLIVGLPGAGKTTRAKELEVSESALRLTPDDWQIGIFSGDEPTRWRSKERADHRDRIEGKLVEAGMRAAQLGINVVFDFGLWSKDERSALRWIADSLGVRTEVVYLPIEYDEQRKRITNRCETQPGQFQMSDAELKQWQIQFQVPDQDELQGIEVPPVPSGHATWSQWASKRWPTLPDQY